MTGTSPPPPSPVGLGPGGVSFPWRSAVIVGCIGLLATGFWLAEVAWVKGWEGLKWLRGYPWAGPVTAVAAALGALTAGAPRGGPPPRRAPPPRRRESVDNTLCRFGVPARRARISSYHSSPSCLNRATDYIHAVKMGYPAFWTVVLVAAAVALGRR